MTSAWLPGARRIISRRDGGSLKGGAPRAVWHTSESDPRTISAHSLAHHLDNQGRSAHLIWNPHRGEIVQMVPATRAARLLVGEIGQEGRTCCQIIVIGFAREPFTDGPLIGLEEIVAWLDTWQVPRRWPAGEPLPWPDAYRAPRLRRAWARGGHFGHSQVPETEGATPGAIDIRRITGPEAPVGVPRPRIASGAEIALDGPDGALGRRPQAAETAHAPPAAPAQASSRS